VLVALWLRFVEFAARPATDLRRLDFRNLSGEPHRAGEEAAYG
jgi:hypothetical protein